jgi:hypothetical protein
MKIFIYKLILSTLFIYILFELTVGSRIDKLVQKTMIFTDHQSRVEAKEKIINEMKKAIKKENYFNEEERLIISQFINKIKSELELSTSN